MASGSVARDVLIIIMEGRRRALKKAAVVAVMVILWDDFFSLSPLIFHVTRKVILSSDVITHIICER
jgi:hypothetical protein